MIITGVFRERIVGLPVAAADRVCPGDKHLQLTLHAHCIQHMLNDDDYDGDGDGDDGDDDVGDDDVGDDDDDNTIDSNDDDD